MLCKMPNVDVNYMLHKFVRINKLFNQIGFSSDNETDPDLRVLWMRLLFVPKDTPATGDDWMNGEEG